MHEACVSLVTFDIILLSRAPRRSTLPICSGAFFFKPGRSDRYTILGKGRTEHPYCVFLGRSEQV